MTDTDDAVSDAEQGVIARYQLADGGFGEPHQRTTVRQAQERLTKAINQAAVGEFDGNEFEAARSPSMPTALTPMPSTA